MDRALKDTYTYLCNRSFISKSLCILLFSAEFQHFVYHIKIFSSDLISFYGQLYFSVSSLHFCGNCRKITKLWVIYLLPGLYPTQTLSASITCQQIKGLWSHHMHLFVRQVIHNACLNLCRSYFWILISYIWLWEKLLGYVISRITSAIQASPQMCIMAATNKETKAKVMSWLFQKKYYSSFCLRILRKIRQHNP